MSKLVFGMVALATLVTAPAVAADLRARPAPVYKSAPITPYYSWTGCYLGGNVGGASSYKSSDDPTRPFAASAALGIPFGDFWKLRLQYRFLYTSYDRADETAVDFRVPESGPTNGLVSQLRFDRLGFTATGEYGLHRRQRWPEWGASDGSDWTPEDRDYSTWRVSVGKEWRFRSFQRLRLESSYLGGSDLDRFSKWSFGFFGGTKMAGFKSGAIRSERMFLASATWGLSIAELFRLDLTVDHARVTDRESGFRDRPFTGIALSGNTNGPFSTILQYSVGAPIQGGEEAKGFVVYLVLLKLF